MSAILLQLYVRLIDTKQDFTLRLSAINSLRGFTLVLYRSQVPISRPTSERLISLLFTLYDALNDDDEELRFLAAEAAAMLLRTFGVRCPLLNPVPIIAQQMLAQYLVKHHHRSSHVLTGALDRLTGSGVFVNVEERLIAALEDDDALFVVEKQNLYMDPVREAWFWCRVLQHLHACSLPHQVLKAFGRWTARGTTALKAHTALVGDGPLGWTSKPEVFALGMQVIHAAEVVLKWRTHGVTSLGVSGSEVRRALREWADVGMERKLHPLWVEAVEELLGRSVEEKLLRVGKVVRDLEVAGSGNAV